MAAHLSCDQPVAALLIQMQDVEVAPFAQGHLFEKNRHDIQATVTEIQRRYHGRLRRLVPSPTPHSLFAERRLLSLPYGAEDDSAAAAEPALCLRSLHLWGAQIQANGWQDEITGWHARWEADDWWPEQRALIYYQVRTRLGRVLTLAADRQQEQWFLVEQLD